MGSVETELTVGVGAGGVVTALADALGIDRVVIDPAVTAAYSRDMMPLAPSGRPLAVVLPEAVVRSAG